MTDSVPGQLATFAMQPSVESVELLARAGFAVVIVDLEHGTTPLASLSGLAVAAAANHARLFVRLPHADPALLASTLDTGVDGVIVAHIDSRLSAEVLVAATRFPPAGERSLNPYVRALDYGRLPPNTADPIVLAMIESSDGLAAATQILATPGLDGIFVGPYDLAAALGRPGHPEDDRVVARIVELQRHAAAARKQFALYADSAEAAARWLDAGAHLVAYGADLVFMANAFAGAATDVRTTQTAGAAT